jgi:phytoene synthase
MRRFGYTEGMLANGEVNDSFAALMRFEIARTRDYYASADAGIASVPADCRLPVTLARILYAKILDKIEENGCDVYRRRAGTTSLEKVGVVIRQRLRQTRRVMSPKDRLPRS